MASNQGYHRNVFPVLIPYLERFLLWKANWLVDSVENEDLAATKLSEVTNSYNNYTHYEQTYIPLLFTETWDQIRDSYSCLFGDRDRFGDMKTFTEKGFELTPDKVVKEKNSDDICYLTCLSWMPLEKLIDRPTLRDDTYRMGSLIVVKINTDLVFAYISDLREIGRGFESPDGPKHRKRFPKMMQFFRITLLIDKKYVEDFDRPEWAVQLTYLRPTLRQIEMLVTLQNYPLGDIILQPDAESCSYINSLPTYSTDEFNRVQTEAINSCVSMVQSIHDSPRLLLIQGPPGTGKSKTLIGAVKSIFGTWNRPFFPRILVCCPSNGAVDELARRFDKLIIPFRNRFGQTFRILRIGEEKNIDSTVKHLLVENVAKGFDWEKMNQLDVIDKERQVCKEKIKNIDTWLVIKRVGRRDPEMVQKQKEEKEMWKQKLNDLDAAKVTVQMEAAKVAQSLADIRLLDDPGIILTTLGSCRRHVLDMLKDRIYFDCLFIDEAAQCTEPEILLPLGYRSIKKMILIGDHKQLPATLVSRNAARYGFGTSLFERLCNFFASGPGRSPVKMLTTQYRMHADICSFPSNYFYEGRLETLYQPWGEPIRPYTVIAVNETKEERVETTLQNYEEATFVRNLFMSLCNLIKGPASIGIITPYQGQKGLLEGKFKLLVACQKNNRITVDVNTVDGFQGQERDVIIISCVRTDGIGFLDSPQRVNVSLTRAKHAIIVCVSGIQTLKRCDLWREFFKDAESRKCLFLTTCKAAIPELQSYVDKNTPIEEIPSYPKEESWDAKPNDSRPRSLRGPRPKSNGKDSWNSKSEEESWDSKPEEESWDSKQEEESWDTDTNDSKPNGTDASGVKNSKPNGCDSSGERGFYSRPEESLDSKRSTSKTSSPSESRNSKPRSPKTSVNCNFSKQTKKEEEEEDWS